MDPTQHDDPADQPEHVHLDEDNGEPRKVRRMLLFQARRLGNRLYGQMVRRQGPERNIRQEPE